MWPQPEPAPTPWVLTPPLLEIALQLADLARANDMGRLKSN